MVFSYSKNNIHAKWKYIYKHLRKNSWTLCWLSNEYIVTGCTYVKKNHKNRFAWFTYVYDIMWYRNACLNCAIWYKCTSYVRYLYSSHILCTVKILWEKWTPLLYIFMENIYKMQNTKIYSHILYKDFAIQFITLNILLSSVRTPNYHTFYIIT